jgi:hypothetical protein
MHALPFLDWAGSWFLPWAQTPGFGGFAAVVAATIAFAASRYQARVQRAAQRKEQWWKRTEWALNLTLSDEIAASEIGISVLEALASSEWANEHEDDVIAAALTQSVTPTLTESTIAQIIWNDDERSERDQIPTDTTSEQGPV